jgi:NADPH:quinone reductase-like Zn-dependent oxidoreductase
MRSVQFDRFGDPSDVLVVRDVPIPEPRPGQVRVRMIARPIHPADLMFIHGNYGVVPKLPSTAGFEGMGVVDAAGPETQLAPGTRVCVIGVGTWQDYLVLPDHAAVAVSDKVSDEAAAQVFINPVTAYAMLEELNLKPGEWLLQTAAASTLGKMVIALAKKKGVKTINTVRRSEQVSELKLLGADEVIDTEHENLVDRVMEITSSRGAAGALDAVGGELGSQVVDCLARHSTMLVYGILSMKPTEALNSKLIFRSLTIKGFWLSEWFPRASAEAKAAAVGTVMQMLETGELDPTVEARYPLEQVREAAHHARPWGRHGKVLLVS